MTWFWGVLTLLSLVFGGLSFWDRGRVRKANGRLSERVEQAEKERDEAIKLAEIRARPVDSPEERQAAARRELDRRRGLRESAGRS